MKQFLQSIVILFLPFLLTSCEEGIFNPKEPKCFETRQEDQNGLSTERIYGDQGIEQLQRVNNGELQYYYAFTYGSNNKITESQYITPQNNSQYPTEYITYNEAGKWVKSTATYANGTVVTYAAEYNDQNQIRELTSSTNRAGTVTTNYTIEYTWENGNNIRRIYTSPTQIHVTQYEFDLSRENKRRKEQEKISFIYLSVGHNKNMYKGETSTITTTATGAVTETTVRYNYEYNENGYPSRVTRNTTSGSGSTTTNVTDFTYNCD